VPGRIFIERVEGELQGARAAQNGLKTRETHSVSSPGKYREKGM
jgi:hypothetical protein